jgi:hypothetical protein
MITSATHTHSDPNKEIHHDVHLSLVLQKTHVDVDSTRSRRISVTFN